VFNEKDYNKEDKVFENGKQYKIMPYKKLKCFAIDAVATKAGIIISPLMSELIGHEELTTFRGGFCGNEIRKDYFQDPIVDMRVRREIAEYTVKFSDFLYRGAIPRDFRV
jgi:hypothetical protein